MAEYKEIEKNRYNNRAKEFFRKLDSSKSVAWGYQTLPMHLQSPYKFYHEVIAMKSFNGSKILDMCCGDGLHSFTSALNGANLTVTDIAEYNVKVTIEKGRMLGLCIEGIVSDIDNLKIGNNSFDLGTCAGSMSYVEIYTFVPNVYNMLKKGGYFIAVDSFNHNPIYRFNRWIHYLKGNRSYHVNQNIPSENTIKFIKKYFDEVEVRYFGIFTFAVPILRLFLSPKKINIVLDILDNKFSFLKKYSFKIVIIAKKT